MSGLFGVSARALAGARALDAPPRPRWARWTPDDDAALRRLWPLGGVDLAAPALGRGPAGVEMRARRLGLAAPPRGLTVVELARAAGCGPHRARTAVRFLGIELSPRPTRNGRRGAKNGPQLEVSPADAARALAWLSGPLPERVHLPRARPTPRGPAGAWGVNGRPARCNDCGTRDRPHHARGECKRCNQRSAYRARVARKKSA